MPDSPTALSDPTPRDDASRPPAADPTGPALPAAEEVAEHLRALADEKLSGDVASSYRRKFKQDFVDWVAPLMVPVAADGRFINLAVMSVQHTANFLLLTDERCFRIAVDEVREYGRGDGLTDAYAKVGLVAGKLTVISPQVTETWKIFPKERAPELAEWFRAKLVSP